MPDNIDAGRENGVPVRVVVVKVSVNHVSNREGGEFIKSALSRNSEKWPIGAGFSLG
jgi:hypothetical protein